MTTLSLPRPRRIRPLAILVASAALVAASQLASLVQPPPPATAPGGGAGVAVGPPEAGPAAPIGAPVEAAPGSLATIDRSIATWSANLARNDRDFLAAGTLGQLYEARARLGGDVSDYVRAAEAADRSLAIEPRQLDVRALRARLLLASHEFRRAYDEAAELDRAAPDEPAILAIMADAALELGDVEAATSLYDRLGVLAPGPALDARRARVAFLRGDPQGAVALAEAAFSAVEAEGLAGPALGWYACLAGLMHLALGAPESAAVWFDRALEAWPDGHLALAGRARAAAALGDVDAAIGGYRAAVAIAPQPDALAALGDLLALRGRPGDAAAAEELYATVRAIARLQGADGPVYDRQLALFEADHDGDPAAALALAERELVERKDIYGYDALAWALRASGRLAEAEIAMTRALELGTRDAMLLYHAGTIALEAGDEARGRRLLEAALEIRGALDPLSAVRAAAALESLR